MREFHPRGVVTGWGAVRMQAWSNVAGIEIGFDVDAATVPPCPYTAMIGRDWLAAADAFGDIGWIYDQALMLSMLDDEPPLTEALDLARRLRAEPLATHVMRRMRQLEMRIPRGERETTRFNPAGLTARQLEVLTLVASGRTNAEIADALVVSQRTAEHHVAAVLTKLGVTTRREAAKRATELGLAGTT
jgi:DNA-binding CsgD family transcriptional regulator